MRDWDEERTRPIKGGKKHRWLYFLLVIPWVIILCAAVYFLPPVYERVHWRVMAFRAQVQYALWPPEEIVFLPVDRLDLDTIVAATVEALTGAQPLQPGQGGSGGANPSAKETPLAEAVRLVGVRYQAQRFNNCGPANLSMALSFWGWAGDQDDTGAALRPKAEDKNVMPYEMAAYVEANTEFEVIWRVGGELKLVKGLLESGYPVMLEKGTDHDGWVGHYVLATGYDDRQGMLVVQDSLSGADMLVSYTQVEDDWLAFNFTFLVVYPPEEEQQVRQLLGDWNDAEWAAGYALGRANEAIQRLDGREVYFAWFNKGSSHTMLGEYDAGALAYDYAFQLYRDLPLETRPWRMMWYQSGPYEAYFHAGRNWDVINLAETSLYMLADRALEEAYYWRGKAHLALGDTEQARKDFEAAVNLNPNFQLGYEALRMLDVGL